MEGMAALPVARALGALSREERALALVATALAGRAASGLTHYLDPDRAPLLDQAITALLALPVGERGATLASEARRLAVSGRSDPRRLHPERRRRLLAAEPARAAVLLAPLWGEPPSAAWGRAHPAVLEVVEASLEAAPVPWPEEVAAAPAPVRALLRASTSRLEVVARTLGPAAMRVLLAASPPVVAAWLRKRLPPAVEAEIDAAPAGELAPALEALAALTRTEERS
jgi:hypothetical protein